jgi:iron complex outermembrane receptor protein
LSRRRLLIAVALSVGVARAEEKPVEVVVHEDRLDRSSKRERTAASTQIPRAELEAPGADLGDVLQRVPGTQVQRSGSSSDFSTASLRGATSAQTPVYLAGIRLNDDLIGAADLSQAPLWMLERVEVFRGTAPEGVDRMGMGGAVLLEPRFPRRPTLGAGIEAGSFGHRSILVGGASARAGAGALVGLRYERADNDYEYVDDAGTTATSADDRVVRRPNADARSWDVWAIGRTRLGRDARLTTLLNGFSREQGVTGLGVIPARHARARVQRTLVGVRSSVPCAAGCRLELTTSALLGSHRLSDPRGELGVGAAELTSRGTRAGQTAHLIWDPLDTLRLRLGGSEELEILRIDPGLRARRDASRIDASARVEIDRDLSLALVGALERHATLGGSDHSEVLAPAVRAGAELRLDEHVSLLANVVRSTRVPTLGELYGVSAIVRGNPALVSETGHSVDLGARAALRGDDLSLGGDVFVFARVADDLVAYRRASFGAVRPYNVGRARFLGLEFSGNALAFDHARLDVALTLLDPRDLSEGRQIENTLLPFQARLVGSARLELFADGLGRIDRVAVGASAQHRSSRVADPAGLVVIEEQWTLNSDLAVLLVDRRLALRLAAENLLDSEQFDSVGMPLPGRRYYGSAELWW